MYNQIMELATTQFDTYKVVNLLKEKGFTKKQAEGFVEAIQNVSFTGISKDDLLDVESTLRGEVQTIRESISSMKVWFMGLVLAQTVGTLGVVFTMFQFFLGQ